MPSREGCEEDEGQECEDDGNDKEVGEDDGVFERAGHPNQVKRVLIDADQICKRGRILVTHPCSAICFDTDAEVSNSYSKVGVVYYVGNGGRHARVDLHRAENRRILLVVQGDEIDVGYQRGG